MSAWVSQHEKAVIAKYGTTSPLLNVAKAYGLDYGDVLLYADAFLNRHYDNSVHTAAAFKHIRELPADTRAKLAIDMNAIMGGHPDYNPKGSESYT